MMHNHNDKTPIMGQYRQLPPYAGDGNFTEILTDRRGTLITQDQIMAWALEGRLFHAQQGDATTQLDFAETAYDEDQPQFALRVPTGTLVIPVSLIVSLEDMAGTDTLCAWSTTTNDIGSSTSTAATISAMRTDAPRSSKCTARSLYTANATAATGLIEFARWVEPFAAEADRAMPRFVWDIQDTSAIPIVVGPGTLQMHIHGTGTAPQGFGEYVFAEFDTPELVIS